MPYLICMMIFMCVWCLDGWLLFDWLTLHIIVMFLKTVLRVGIILFLGFIPPGGIGWFFATYTEGIVERLPLIHHKLFVGLQVDWCKNLSWILYCIFNVLGFPCWVFWHFRFAEELDFSTMLLLLAAINKLPQFDLQPIHHFITFLDLVKGPLLVCFHENLNQLLHLFVFPFIISQTIFP